MIIISGMHRSGTTFMGKFIESSKKYHSIHEPFNFNFGMKGIPCWYPSIETMQELDSEKVNELIDHMMTGKFNFKKGSNLRDNFFKKRLRSLVGSKGELDYYLFKIFYFRRRLIIKDPFLVLSARFMLKKYSEVKFIFLVRHPVAIYNSIQRMNWSFDFNKFLEINRLVSNQIYPKSDNKLYEDIDSCCGLWNIINREILALVAEYPDRVLVVKHEDFSSDPELWGNKIFTFIGDQMNQGVFNFIHAKMRADTVVPSNNKQHVLIRNSKELAVSWMNTKENIRERILLNCDEMLRAFDYK